MQSQPQNQDQARTIPSCVNLISAHSDTTASRIQDLHGTSSSVHGASVELEIFSILIIPQPFTLIKEWNRFRNEEIAVSQIGYIDLLWISKGNRLELYAS